MSCAAYSPTHSLDRHYKPLRHPLHGGSARARVILTARADAFEPTTDVIQRGRVEPGTHFELGEHPFGVNVSLDVENSGGAGMVSAHISQDNASSKRPAARSRPASPARSTRRAFSFVTTDGARDVSIDLAV
jgi:hypothetical protein